jgi:glycosyltransferase involved in cell wall biosynthesis
VNDPTVSVLFVVGNQRERAARALASILGQNGIDRAEVVLLDCGRPPMESLPGADDPVVRVFPRPERGDFGALRADAVRLSRSPIVVFVEEHVEVLPGWLEAIESAFADGAFAGVGAEVHSLNSGVGVSDLIAAMNYVRWQPPARRREDVDVIVGHNAAYLRAALIAFGVELDDLLGSEPVLQRRLVESGGRLLVDPAVRIAHRNEVSVRSICRGYYLWNVSFGATWAATDNWSAMRRAAQVVGIPWWVARRVTQMVHEALPETRRELLRRLPAVLAAQTSGAFGIAIGCTLGDRGHGGRFTDYELDEPRGPVSTSSL